MPARASSPAPRCSPQEAHASVNGDCKAGRSNPVPRVCERSGFGAASGSSSRRSRRTARRTSASREAVHNVEVGRARVLCPNAGPVSGRRCVASLCCSPELEPRALTGAAAHRAGGARQLHVVALLRLEEGGGALVAEEVARRRQRVAHLGELCVAQRGEQRGVVGEQRGPVGVGSMIYFYRDRLMYAPCWRGCYPAVAGASKSVIILLIQHHSSVICPILTFLQRTAEHSYHSSRACMVDCALTAPPPLPRA